MRAASLAERQVPKLCSTDSVEAWGSCRLCSWKSRASKAPRLLHHAGRARHAVTTQNDRLARLRKA